MDDDGCCGCGSASDDGSLVSFSAALHNGFFRCILDLSVACRSVSYAMATGERRCVSFVGIYEIAIV